MKVFVVIPTFNEAENIKELTERILELHPTFNIIIVDDNSPDGTGEIADSVAREDPRITVVHRAKKAGLGTAYVEGFGFALKMGADLILEMDADFSHGPEYIQELLRASSSHDLVIGSRYSNGVRVEGWSLRRLLLSRFANMFVSYVTRLPVRDATSGFRCYRRRVLEGIGLRNITSDGYAFQIEMAYQACRQNFSIFEVPIIFKERKRGVSKISRSVIFEAFWLVLKLRGLR